MSRDSTIFSPNHAILFLIYFFLICIFNEKFEVNWLQFYIANFEYEIFLYREFLISEYFEPLYVL